MKSSNKRGLAQVIEALGVSASALLGEGGESWVFSLDVERIARVNRPGTSQAQTAARNALLAELGPSTRGVNFAIPVVLDTVVIEGHIVTIERRLPGRPLDQVLEQLAGDARDTLIRAYLETAAQIGDLVIHRPWYGELVNTTALRTTSFSAYLEEKAAHSLIAAGPLFKSIDPARLATLLPEPEKASMVHLDAFPGNMLAEEETITAVLDFGAPSIMGDRRLDPLTAAIYLAPPITPIATNRDRSVAREWLVENGLADLFHPVKKWIAAYWSFATDDITLHRWCKSVLIG